MSQINNTKIYTFPIADDNYAFGTLRNKFLVNAYGTYIAANNNSSEMWLFVKLINQDINGRDEGWIKASSVPQVSEDDFDDLPEVIPPSTPTPVSFFSPQNNPSPIADPAEFLLGATERKQGKLVVGEVLTIPLDVTGESFSITFLCRPRSTGITFAVVANGRVDDPLGRGECGSRFRGDPNTGVLPWTGTNLTENAEFELVFENNSDSDIDYCLMAYSATGWDCE